MLRPLVASAVLVLALATAARVDSGTAATPATAPAAPPAAAPAAPPAAAPAATPDPFPLKATVTAVREIGAAMFAWAVDFAGERTTDTGATHAETPEPEAVRWSACPPITYEELRALLVPKYVAEMPSTDAWGHPFELCMNKEGVKVRGRLVLGVRSAGADGRFDGDTYTVGAFDREQPDHDIVWLDGYFVTWPMKK